MMNEAILIGKKLNINIKLTIEKRIEGAKMLEIIKPQHFKIMKIKDRLELNALINSLIELGKLSSYFKYYL